MTDEERGTLLKTLAHRIQKLEEERDDAKNRLEILDSKHSMLKKKFDVLDSKMNLVLQVGDGKGTVRDLRLSTPGRKV